MERGLPLRGQTGVLDKGYRNQALVRLAKEKLGLALLPRQLDPQGTPPSFFQERLDQLRKPIEGVLSLLTERFSLDHLRVRTKLGLHGRTQPKATALSLAR